LGRQVNALHSDQSNGNTHARAVILLTSGGRCGDWSDSGLQCLVLAEIDKGRASKALLPSVMGVEEFYRDIERGALDWTQVSVSDGLRTFHFELSVLDTDEGRRISVRNVNSLSRLLEVLPESKLNTIDPELGVVNQEGLHYVVEQTILGLQASELYQPMIVAHITNHKDLQVVLGRDGYINWLSKVIEKIECSKHEYCMTVCVDRNTLAIVFGVRFTSRELCLSYSTSVGQRIRFVLENDKELESDFFHPKINYTALPLGDHHQTADEILAFSKTDISDAFYVEGGVRQLCTSFADERKRHVAFERSVVLALKHDEFYAVFQPKVNMRTGEWVGAEALLRWDNHGVPVSPLEFIDVLDHVGKLCELTEVLLIRLIDQVSDWYDRGLWRSDMVLSINLSPKTFLSEALPKLLESALATTSVHPSMIELEVTEGQFIDDFERARMRVDELRGMGLAIALDDFGTGYSSLSYLQMLRFDTLKIDRSFVESMVSNQVSRTIVKAVIEICDALQLKSIAEGVETLEEEAYLVAIGCSIAQGYLYARPLDRERFEQELIARMMISRDLGGPAEDAHQHGQH